MVNDRLSERDVEILLNSDEISNDIRVMLNNGCRYIGNFEPYKRDLVKTELLKNNSEIRNSNSWEIFSDRAKTLLQRWDEFNSNNLDNGEYSIRNFLYEINDDFTKSLLAKETKEF